ncbi:hypothetical protein [Streptomyces sp. NRRL F-5630]|uniref:hypothetical protein n=1 Tax=Streptomyces sp. NRRL F-5630 TaxID=1463864 RepID=UPI003D73F62C
MSEKRYRLGEQDEDGLRPVFVDGATEAAGHVWRMGRSTRPWRALGTGDERRHATDHTTQHEAAERLVATVDARAGVARTLATLRERAVCPPEGWRFASWEEIAREGLRRVRPVSRTTHGTDGVTYPGGYTDVPVQLTQVVHQSTGCVVISGRRADQEAPHVLLLTPDHARLGGLVEVSAPRYEGQGRCDCSEEGALYRIGARVTCRRCAGVPREHLPAPVTADRRWWRPGDRAFRLFPLPDWQGHALSGRVHETRLHLSSRVLELGVDLHGSWHVMRDAELFAPEPAPYPVLALPRDAAGRDCPAPGAQFPYSVSDIGHAVVRLLGESWTCEPRTAGVSATVTHDDGTCIAIGVGEEGYLWIGDTDTDGMRWWELEMHLLTREGLGATAEYVARQVQRLHKELGGIADGPAAR